MKTTIQKAPPFYILMLLVSFAAVNAVLFTPALPDIAKFFAISDNTAQLTMSWFLVGYTIGQLIYGPLANRFGRKAALLAGIFLQIISSLLCVFAGEIQQYSILVISRFLLALGSGVGLNMTFTLINEYHEPKIASQKSSYVMLSFAIAPGLAVALGGVLNAHFGWMSCFYVGAIYGFLLFLLVKCLPKNKIILNKDALKWQHLLYAYKAQFKNIPLLVGGLLMGGGTCFAFVFAALTPFIAIELLGMNSTQYGIANMIPLVGILTGTFLSARLTNIYPLHLTMRAGIWITTIGVVTIIVAMLLHLSALFVLFFPMIIIYFGLSLLIGNVSAIALSQTEDKAQGSAVMSFMNMGTTTIIVLSLELFPLKMFLLPSVFLTICCIMMGLQKLMVAEKK